MYKSAQSSGRHGRASFEEVIELPISHQYGNGVAIFAHKDCAAECAMRVQVGKVGVNLPIPMLVAQLHWAWRSDSIVACVLALKLGRRSST